MHGRYTGGILGRYTVGIMHAMHGRYTGGIMHVCVYSRASACVRRRRACARRACGTPEQDLNPKP